MHRNYFYLGSLLLLIILFTMGCGSVGFVDYVGQSFGPTTTVDVYTSTEEIEMEYTVIGHALGIGMPLGISLKPDTKKIQQKLIEEAKRKGADAILIVGTGAKKEYTALTEGAATKVGGLTVTINPGIPTVKENQMKVSFLKYK